MYRYSNTVDTDSLLAERLEVAANEGIQPQNCATVALKYAFGQLGKDVTGSQLADLVSEPDGTTSLYAMKQFAQELGLYCRAVKTDIHTLKNLDGCEAILHIPGKNHFTVLEGIDDEYVWSIDLAGDKFYYCTDISFFGMDWAQGTALLISNQPVYGEFIEVDDGELQTIIGAAGYTCTNLLQEYGVIYCDYIGGLCGGTYSIYWERWGCEAAESGSCSSTRMERYRRTLCIEDPYNPFNCTVTGEWTFYYMRACA
jgi:hypothetical protein